MTATDVSVHRPLIGAVAGLLLLSACGTEAESTPPTEPAIDVVSDHDATTPATGDVTITTTPARATTSPSTTVSPTTNPPDTTLPVDPTPAAEPAPVDVVDVVGGTVFGVSTFDAVDVDAVAGDVSTRIGPPTTDTGWQSMVDQPDCTGSTAFRVLWWGDLRMTFERYEGDGDVRDELSAWTVGDPTIFELAPIGAVPVAVPSDVVTLEGIGLGSTAEDVRAAWANVNDGGDGRLVVVDSGGTLALQIDDVGQVVGFGNGPFDCPVDELR